MQNLKNLFLTLIIAINLYLLLRIYQIILEYKFIKINLNEKISVEQWEKQKSQNKKLVKNLEHSYKF